MILCNNIVSDWNSSDTSPQCCPPWVEYVGWSLQLSQEPMEEAAEQHLDTVVEIKDELEDALHMQVRELGCKIGSSSIRIPSCSHSHRQS